MSAKDVLDALAGAVGEPAYDAMADGPAAFKEGPPVAVFAKARAAAAHLNPTDLDAKAAAEAVEAVEEAERVAFELGRARARLGYGKRSSHVVAVALPPDGAAKCLSLMKRLPYLKYVDASAARGLSAADVEALSALSRVEFLDLSDQLVSDDEVKALAPLGRLRGLSLTNTRLTDRGLELVCRQFPHLERLSVAGTKVTGGGMVHLPALKALNSLDLRDTLLDTDSLAPVGKLTRLEALHLPDVEGRKFGDQVKRAELAVFAQVKEHPFSLDLPDLPTPPGRRPNGNQLDYVRGLQHLSGLTALKDVRMVKALRTCDTPDAREWGSLPLFTCVELKRKHLNGVTRLAGGRLLPEIEFHSSGGFTDLEKAALERIANRPPGRLLEHVAGMKCVTSLDLSEFNVRDDDLKFVAAHEGLTALDLSGSAVTAKGLSHLASLKKLTALNLRGAAVTDKDVEAIAALESLTDLCLSQTKMTVRGVRAVEERLPRVRVVFDEKEERPWWVDVDWEATARTK